MFFYKAKNNKLGFFYSNNYVPQTYPTLKKSLIGDFLMPNILFPTKSGKNDLELKKDTEDIFVD